MVRAQHGGRRPSRGRAGAAAPLRRRALAAAVCRAAWAAGLGRGAALAFAVPEAVARTAAAPRLRGAARQGGAPALPRRAGRARAAWRWALPEAFSAVQAVLDQVPERVTELGPLGPVYFFGVYVLAECLAMPATPLTLSAGYLFGLPLGATVALLAGTTAACIGFFLSRTLLRPQVSKMAAENELLSNVNRAVQHEGFKIILLLRLSPLLPFSLSNYVYGLSDVGFLDFIGATALGFAPGTCAYVYLATTARTVLSEGSSEPWYVYAAGVLVTLGLLKLAADVAKKAVDEALEAEKRHRAATAGGVTTLSE